MDGKVIAVTRAEESQGETAGMIRSRGGIPLYFPTVRFRKARSETAVSLLMDESGSGKIDIIVFMSWNAFVYLSKIALGLGFKDVRRNLGKASIVAIGSQTAQKLASAGLSVDAVAQRYSSDGIAELLGKSGIVGKRIALVRNKSAKSDLKSRLALLGAEVTEIPTYCTRVPREPERARLFIKKMSCGGVDALTFGSPLAAENMFKILEGQIGAQKTREMLSKAVIAAIGPTTAKRLEGLGLRADVVPETYTFKDMLDGLERRL